MLVRAEGLEPPRLSPLEPKSSASTNFATPANDAVRHRGSREILVSTGEVYLGVGLEINNELRGCGR
jgi:hypothetical protein